MTSQGNLQEGEIHPSSHIAYKYVAERATPTLLESLSSCALSGNRLAEICAETLRRFVHNEPISDRYLMGLAWFLYEMENNKNENT